MPTHQQKLPMVLLIIQANGSIAPYVQGVSADGNGDRGQSYSYASASYGDWVYINTMYGALVPMPF